MKKLIPAVRGRDMLSVLDADRAGVCGIAGNFIVLSFLYQGLFFFSLFSNYPYNKCTGAALN